MATESEMVERVARALLSAGVKIKGDEPPTDEEWQMLWADPKQRYQTEMMTRAGILAMREPTDAMRAALLNKTWMENEVVDGKVIPRNATEMEYKRMIDAALK